MKEVYLVFVDPVSNHNKFYRMVERGNTFIAEWGRVGSSSSSKEYPIGKWYSLLESKKEKGYRETQNNQTVQTSVNVVKIQLEESIKSNVVKRVLNFLISCTRESVSKNYNISSIAVTKEQIKIAQKVIDNLAEIKFDNSDFYKSEIIMKKVNELLIELYTQIPRKMRKVSENIFNNPYKSDYAGITWSEENYNKKISGEQDILDSMKTQKDLDVQASKEVDDKFEIPFEIEEATEEDYRIVKKMMGDSANKIISILKVNNKETKEKFNLHKEKLSNKRTELYFHGSRNENWYGIMKAGLVLRPSNAIINGKMFGHGTYFADKSQKSIGYTSLSGSYWTNGNSSIAFLAVYEVLVGNWFHVRKHDYWMNNLNERELKTKGDYHSLFAEGGYDLRNNEYIIYNENQSTIKYLIEIKG